MIITELQADFSLHHEAKPRSPGLHVSEIIREIATDLGFWKGDERDELDWTMAKYRLQFGEDITISFPQAIYRVAFGLAWEQWYGAQHPHLNLHAIGELSKDGLIGTPDGLEFRPGTHDISKPGPQPKEYGIVHECKATWTSSRSHSETPDQQMAHRWAWLAQVKAYCWMAHSRAAPVLDAIFHVYYVNGAYRGGGPEFKQYHLKFTEQELQVNWKLLVNTGKHILARRGTESDDKRVLDIRTKN